MNTKKNAFGRGASLAVFGFGALLAWAVSLAALPASSVTAERAGDGESQQPVNALGAVPSGLGPDQSFVGTPWTGEPGVTETVAQIMAREAAQPKVSRPPRETKPFRRFAGPKRDSPGAPAVSQWPPAPAETAKESAPATSTGFVPVTNWYGPKLSESGFIPPDSNGAVGPTQVMVIANGRYKLYDKSGGLQGLDVTDVAFWGASAEAEGVSDARIRYDPLSGRWFIVAIDDHATSNRILVAVSSGSAITSSSSFTKFFFAHDTVGTTPNVDTGNFADSPTLGVDANALYIGTNEFQGVTPFDFLNTTGYVVNKANLIAGTLNVTAFRGLIDGTNTGPFTPQGVANDDASATEGYFIGVDNNFFSKLDIRRVTSPGGTPSISGNLTLSVPVTRFPIGQVALGSTNPLDALDDRLFAAAITKNRITGVGSLWTAHNIEVNSSGVGTEGGGRNGSRWYQIDNLTTTPTLTQSGTVYDPSASNPAGYWIPSVAANGQGHVLFGSSWAGALIKPDVVTGGRLSGDAAGTMPQGNVTFGAGDCLSYNVGTPNPQRWGDFSQVVVDPVDDQTMWTFQEICDATNSWSVLAVKMQMPPPSTPSGASPAAVAPNVASTDVTITGTLGATGGFFDAGPGFTRIAASVSGGVTVNSVTFVDATHVTLNISTVGTTVGAKNVTITNPDGQQSTGDSLLCVGSCFTDDPLFLNITTIKAVHITELRTRIDAVRATYLLPPFAYTYSVTTASVIHAKDITEMRDALSAAYTAAAMPQPTYTTSPAIGGAIVMADIKDLRDAVLAIGG